MPWTIALLCSAECGDSISRRMTISRSPVWADFRKTSTSVARIEAGLDPGGETLDGGEIRAEDRAVVEDLARAAGANRANVKHGRGHGFKNG